MKEFKSMMMLALGWCTGQYIFGKIVKTIEEYCSKEDKVQQSGPVDGQTKTE